MSVSKTHCIFKSNLTNGFDKMPVSIVCLPCLIFAVGNLSKRHRFAYLSLSVQKHYGQAKQSAALHVCGAEVMLCTHGRGRQIKWFVRN